MTDERSLLERIIGASGDAWIASVAPDADIAAMIDPYLRPPKKLIAAHSDEDLSELIAARPATREAEIARSIMREREAWRTPARWSFIVAAISLVISIASAGIGAAAFFRTL